MTDFGPTPTGFVRKQFTDILTAISDSQKAKISSTLDTTSSRSVIGNCNNIVADELSQAWEALEAAYNGFDPDNAVDYLLEALCALSGITRNPAQPGSVQATVVVGAGFSGAAGDMVAHVAGQPTNLWTNAVPITASGTYLFKSTSLGASAVAPAGTLTIIAQPLSGWTSITNATDAAPGTDLESIEQLRIRRELSLSEAGTTTLPAMAVDLVNALASGTSVRIQENPLDYFANGLPPHSVHVILDTGSSNNEIAQAIYNAKTSGATTVGGQTGSAIDVNGAAVTPPIFFDRGTTVTVTVDVTIVATGFDAAAIKAAVIGAFPNQLGASAYNSALVQAVRDLGGITDVAITMDRGAGPTSGNISAAISEKLATDNAHITVHT